MLEFPNNLTSHASIDVWCKLQAAGFCFTTTILCQSVLDPGGFWAPSKALLEAGAWTRIRGMTPESHPSEYLKLAVILHTLANKTIGLLGAQLRAYLAENRLIRCSNILSPWKIPFSSKMNLPDLYDSNSVRDFSLCHVAKMATPEFFEGSLWTGYECILSRVFPFVDPVLCQLWDSIGRDNRRVQRNNFDQPPYTNGNTRSEQVERQAKFELTRWEDSRIYLLQSNHFQTENEIHCLTLRVDSSTGMIHIVRHVDFDGDPKPSTGDSGVITPFGILFGGICLGYWLWLWKVDWSSTSLQS